MLLGPVFTADMVTLGRRGRYTLLRAAYAACLLFVLWVSYAEQPMYTGANANVSVANVAARFFEAFVWVQLVFALLFTPAIAAGPIALERERRTLEYLFATHLSNLEIIGGKLAARLLHVFLLILAGVPVLACATLLGGIAPEAIFMSAIIAGSTVLAIAALSVAISVFAPRARDAVIRAYLVLLVLLALPWLAWLLCMRYTPGLLQGPGTFLLDHATGANPLYVLGMAMSGGSSSRPGAAWRLVGSMTLDHLLLAMFCLAIALYGLRRAGRQAKETGWRRRWRRFRLLRFSLGERPMLWKELVVEPGGGGLGIVGRLATLLLIAAVVASVVISFIESRGANTTGPMRGFMVFQTTMMLTGAIGCVGLLLLAARAAGLITGEKERDCWTSLIGTPLTGGEIVRAKLLGNLWSIRWVIACLLFVWGGGCLMDPGFVVVCPFLAGGFLLLACYASVLGLTFSFHCRNTLRAMGATLSVGVIAGGVYLFCCIPCFALSHAATGKGLEVVFAPCIPFLLASPVMAYAQWDHLGPGSEFGDMLAIYILGLIAYLAVTAILFGLMISDFDRLAGRISRRVADELRRKLS
jgi:ABC-type transport system involved in multi-copper enzyme maturation permease subunit